MLRECFCPVYIYFPETFLYADFLRTHFCCISRPDILKEKFNAYGEVGDVYIPRVPGSSDPRGFAFIRFLNKKDADDALQALDNTEIDGRVIRIQEAKEKRPDHSNNNRNNRGG